MHMAAFFASGRGGAGQKKKFSGQAGQGRAGSEILGVGQGNSQTHTILYSVHNGAVKVAGVGSMSVWDNGPPPYPQISNYDHFCWKLHFKDRH